MQAPANCLFTHWKYTDVFVYPVEQMCQGITCLQPPRSSSYWGCGPGKILQEWVPKWTIYNAL